MLTLLKIELSGGGGAPLSAINSLVGGGFGFDSSEFMASVSGFDGWQFRALSNFNRARKKTHVNEGILHSCSKAPDKGASRNPGL